MAKKLYEETAVANIANAIRNKNGQTTTYKIAEMAQAINDIPTGGGELPSFEFTGSQMANLFQNNRLTQLHDIGYTTNNITDLGYAYSYVNAPTINTPIINLSTTDSGYIDCGYAFSDAKLNSVNINGDGILINASGMFSDSSIKTINFNGIPKIGCSRWSCKPTSIFYNCQNITDIPTLEFVKYTGSSDTELSFDDIFQNCWKLKHRSDEIIIDHADFYNNGVNYIRFSGTFSNNYSMAEFPQWLYGFANSPSLFTYGNLSFSSCYSLQNVVLPMSNNVAYNSGYIFDYNCSLKSVKFQTQENGTPYTANWSSSLTWNLGSLGAWADSNTYTYTNYLIMDNSRNVHTFTNAKDFIEYAESLGAWTDIGYKYTANGVEYTKWSTSTNNNGYFTRFWSYKLVYCWNEQDAEEIRAKGYIPYGMSYIYSLYNHDSAVETINSLPDCSGCAAQTIQFAGNAGSAYGKAISTLTAEEIAVATAKNWTVAIN